MYEVSYINLSQGNMSREATQRSEIRKLLPVIILHLKWFNNFARKMRNDK